MIAKPGVRLDTRKPVLVVVDDIVDRTTQRLFGRDAICTSTNDSAHSSRSLHYEDYAEDLRVNDQPEQLHQRYADELREDVQDFDEALAPYWDILYEPDRHPAAEIDTSHVHMEFDIRRWKADNPGRKHPLALPEPDIEIVDSITKEDE